MKNSPTDPKDTTTKLFTDLVPVTWLPANELHSDLEVFDKDDWYPVHSVDRRRHQVHINVAGVTIVSPANREWQTRPKCDAEIDILHNHEIDGPISLTDALNDGWGEN